jgi:hypothetical protein
MRLYQQIGKQQCDSYRVAPNISKKYLIFGRDLRGEASGSFYLTSARNGDPLTETDLANNDAYA